MHENESNLKEWRIFGPPGTGKTTELSKRIHASCRKHGSESVLVMSFTRTAAIELVGRDLPLDKERVGTLHSFAFRALGRPEIAEVPKHLKEWNDWIRTKKGQGTAWTIDPSKHSSRRPNIDDPYAIEVLTTESHGDSLLSVYSRARTRMDKITGSERMDVAEFAKFWEEWKEEANVVDFTDLIHRAYISQPVPPISARILYADEVQDFSPLELKLVRRWGESMDYIVLAGDDDQTIYAFRGSIPQAFMDPQVPERQRIVLPVSYRLPPEIKDKADRWISSVSVRQEKKWSARPGEPGAVLHAAFHYKNAPTAVSRVRSELNGEGSSTAMILTSCGYMLDSIIRELRMQGVPYHNPYRVSHGGWNPVGAIARRVLAFLITDHTVHENPHSHTWGSVQQWMHHVDAKRAKLKRGAKKLCRDNAGIPEMADKSLSYDDFTERLGIDPPPRGDLDWLETRIKPKEKRKYAYVLHVCRTKGAKILTQKPQIVVGTIHSVKGGEADSVFLFPDLSTAGHREWKSQNPEERDAIRRLFYVGMTRARRRLILCTAFDSRFFVPWNFGR